MASSSNNPQADPLGPTIVNPGRLSVPQPSLANHVYRATGAGSIAYIDCSAHAGQIVRFHGTGELRFLWVESATPATTPTAAATAEDESELDADVMDRLPADAMLEQVVDKRRPFFAYIVTGDVYLVRA